MSKVLSADHEGQGNVQCDALCEMRDLLELENASNWDEFQSVEESGSTEWDALGTWGAAVSAGIAEEQFTGVQEASSQEWNQI